MPYNKGRKEEEGIRSYAEAWDLALDHQKMLYKLLYTYVSKHSLPYYKGEALVAELESFAWEAFFDACRKWDESKGNTLSTYAYPAVTNAMNARMKVLARMGSSMVGYQEKGIKHERPGLSSLEGLDSSRAEFMDLANGGSNGLSDLRAPAWSEGPEPLMEDTIVDALDKEERINKIKAIVTKMSEPHKTIFTLIYLTKPTHERRPVGTGLGGGYTLHEAAATFGRDTTWAKGILDEAIEYVKFQLKAEEREAE